MLIQSLLAFPLAISIVYKASKILSLELSLVPHQILPLLVYHCIGFQYCSVLITNWLLLSTVHSTMPALSICLHCFNPTLDHVYLRSASINLLPASNQHYSSYRGFRYAGPSLWNSLPPHLRSIDSYSTFKSNLKTHLFSTAASVSGP